MKKSTVTQGIGFALFFLFIALFCVSCEHKNIFMFGGGALLGFAGVAVMYIAKYQEEKEKPKPSLILPIYE